MNRKKISQYLGYEATDWVMSKIKPDYNSWVKGWCTDLEYFKYQYAGKDGTVIKRVHPYSIEKPGRELFYVRRPIVDPFGTKQTEFKVYDKTGKLITRCVYNLHRGIYQSEAKQSVAAFAKTAQYCSDVFFYIDVQNEFYAIAHGINESEYFSCAAAYSYEFKPGKKKKTNRLNAR